MVDVALSQAVVRKLNRWYRKRANPRGTVDHIYRGIRLTRNRGYRMVVCGMSLFLLIPGCALFLVPDLFKDETPAFVLFLKAGWTGIFVLILLAPLQAFREFAVVNDEGLMLSNLFGRQKKLDWREITHLQIKLDDNEVVFLNHAQTKLKLNLGYNGWQDLLETSVRHLDQTLQGQLESIFAETKCPKA